MPESSFEFFYNKAKIKAEEAIKAVYDKNLNKNYLRKKAVDFLYKNFPSNEKQIFYNIAVLNKKKMIILNAKSKIIKLSVENLAKNIINHPEINFNEYSLILKVIENPELLIHISDEKYKTQKIICFAYKSKYYTVVIKTTADKKENYLQTFHVTDIKEINKEIKKKGIKIIFDKLTQKNR